MSTTRIPATQETLRRLRSYKVGGTTHDDVLNDLMDDQPAGRSIREHLRRLKKENLSDWKDMQKRSRVLLDRRSDEHVSEDEIVEMVQDGRSQKSRR